MVVDYNTGTVLLAKNEEEALPPASMSKLMTLNMVFEALEQGRLSLNDTFRVSAKAAAKGGSKMFVREGDRVRVEDLILGVIVHSGNDACIVLAEGLAGSEEAFATRMTERAFELGMQDSTFGNATGWPDPRQRMSARDLVFLAERLITEFPQYYNYFAVDSFTWEGIVQNNRNPLLNLGIGADGLKTGHTEEAGYGLVGSAKRDDRRVILMISGLPDDTARSTEAERLTNWAFREFGMRTLFEKGTEIDTASIWLGAADTVSLVVDQDVEVLIPLAGKEKVTASYSFEEPVRAPVEAGQKIGEIVVTIPDHEDIVLPLVAKQAVAAGGFGERVRTATELLIQEIRAFTSGS